MQKILSQSFALNFPVALAGFDAYGLLSVLQRLRAQSTSLLSDSS